jgi:hypothetical protein
VTKNVEVTITYQNGKVVFTPDPVTIPGDGNSTVFWNNKDSRGDVNGRHWMCAQGGDPADPNYTGWKTPQDGPQLPQAEEGGLIRPGSTPTVAFGGKKGAANDVRYWSSFDKKTIGTIQFE